MKHKLVFGLCITVFLSAGAAIASVALMLFERQDIALLRAHIARLSDENAVLQLRLEEDGCARNSQPETN